MAKLTLDDKWIKRNRLILSFIPALVFGAALFFAQLDKTPDVKYIGEVVHPGYETSPAYYQVEASSRKEWGDYWAGYWFCPLLGIALAVFGTMFYINYVETNVKRGSWVVIMFFWLSGAIIIMLPFMAMMWGDNYSTTLTPDNFEAWKNNLDALFPIK